MRARSVNGRLSAACTGATNAAFTLRARAKMEPRAQLRARLSYVQSQTSSFACMSLSAMEDDKFTESASFGNVLCSVRNSKCVTIITSTKRQDKFISVVLQTVQILISYVIFMVCL